jgi:hypothetical protein
MNKQFRRFIACDIPKYMNLTSHYPAFRQKQKFPPAPLAP